MSQGPKNRRLLVAATLLIVTATVSLFLWWVRPARADAPTVLISSSPAVTLKFSDVPPNQSLTLLGEIGVAPSPPPTTDTRLITVSNTGSGTIDLVGMDNTTNPRILAVVGAGQTVALSLPTVWFATALRVANFGTATGQGVVTIN